MSCSSDATPLWGSRCEPCCTAPAGSPSSRASRPGRPCPPRRSTPWSSTSPPRAAGRPSTWSGPASPAAWWWSSTPPTTRRRFLATTPARSSSAPSRSSSSGTWSPPTPPSPRPRPRPGKGGMRVGRRRLLLTPGRRRSPVLRPPRPPAMRPGPGGTRVRWVPFGPRESRALPVRSAPLGTRGVRVGKPPLGVGRGPPALRPLERPSAARWRPMPRGSGGGSDTARRRPSRPTLPAASPEPVAPNRAGPGPQTRSDPSRPTPARRPRRGQPPERRVRGPRARERLGRDPPRPSRPLDHRRGGVFCDPPGLRRGAPPPRVPRLPRAPARPAILPNRQRPGTQAGISRRPPRRLARAQGRGRHRPRRRPRCPETPNPSGPRSSAG
jgi:hypothetical protein